MEERKISYLKWCTAMLYICIILLYHAAVEVSTGTLESSSSVIRLTTNNYTKFTEDHYFFTLAFLATWCSTCTRIAPEYEIAAKWLSKLPNPVVCAVVYETDPDIIEEYNVTVFPTLFIRRGEDVERYKLPITAANLVDFLQREAALPYRIIENWNEVRLFKNPMKGFVVGLFDSLKNKKLHNFEKLCRKLRDKTVFVVSTDVDVRRKFDSENSKYAIFLIAAALMNDRSTEKTINITWSIEENSGNLDNAKRLELMQLPVVGEYAHNMIKLYENIQDELFCVVFLSDYLSSRRHSSAGQVGARLYERVAKHFDSIRWILLDEVEHPTFASQFSKDSENDDLRAACRKGSEILYHYNKKVQMRELLKFAHEVNKEFKK